MNLCILCPGLVPDHWIMIVWEDVLEHTLNVYSRLHIFVVSPKMKVKKRKKEYD